MATEPILRDVQKPFFGFDPDTLKPKFQDIYIGGTASPSTILDQLLDMKQVGIRLTESGMMTPHASVSGLMFAHPMAKYFELGKIGDDQLRDYARRRGVPVELMKRFLQSSLLK